MAAKKARKRTRSVASAPSKSTVGTPPAALTKRQQRKEGRRAFMRDFLSKRWVLVILAIAVSGSILVGYWTDTMFSEVQYITPQTIAQAFDENDINAEFQYVDKEVIASGTVSWTGDAEALLVGRRFMIRLQDASDSDPACYIDCYFAKTLDQLPELKSIAVGQELKIKGKFVGSGAEPMMAACSIVA